MSSIVKIHRTRIKRKIKNENFETLIELNFVVIMTYIDIGNH